MKKNPNFFIKDEKKPKFLHQNLDAEQTIFKHGFNPKSLRFNNQTDIMVLKKNLRNSNEIGKYLKILTGFGEYEEFSGINGFKITKKKFSSAERAIIKSFDIIKEEFFKQSIGSNV